MSDGKVWLRSKGAPLFKVHFCGPTCVCTRMWIENNCFSTLLVEAGSLNQSQSSLIRLVLPGSLFWGSAF